MLVYWATGNPNTMAVETSRPGDLFRWGDMNVTVATVMATLKTNAAKIELAIIVLLRLVGTLKLD